MGICGIVYVLGTIETNKQLVSRCVMLEKSLSLLKRFEFWGLLVCLLAGNFFRFVSERVGLVVVSEIRLQRSERGVGFMIFPLSISLTSLSKTEGVGL